MTIEYKRKKKINNEFRYFNAIILKLHTYYIFYIFLLVTVI